MDTPALIASLRSESAAVAAAARQAPGAAVTACPGWDMTALVAHLVGVQRWTAAIVAGGERVRQRDVERLADPTSAADTVAAYEVGAEQLLGVLSAADPEAQTWTFAGSGDRRVAWWIRRAAAETAVHRFDAERAARIEPPPMDRALAVEGIEEHLVDFLPGAVERSEHTFTGSLHLHATDDGPEVEWLVDLDARPVTAAHGHATATTAIRASASDLVLWLWNRLPAGGAGLDVVGSTDMLTSWPHLAL